MISNQKQQERAVLVGVITQHQTKEQAEEYLEELAFLAETAGAVTVERFFQKMEHPDPRTYLGTGKLNDIALYIVQNQIDLVIFDDELSPSQIRNIEQTISCKILDRSNLILDIFASRARTAQSKTQVELAQCQYLLPRLTRMWTHLSKQKGGIGMKGPGEKEIETDRRVLRERITLLKARLREIDKQSETQRKNRGKSIRVALVGYTNVGKSTLMNAISKSEVFAENKLFATLDATVRKVVLEQVPFLLSDTVGFIRKLPHHLVESFKSTLDEVRESDILLHVVDVSHAAFEDQMHVVNETLKDIKAHGKPTLIVFNKIDNIPTHPPVKEDHEVSAYETEGINLESLQRSWVAKENPAVFVSALEKDNLNLLKETVTEMVKQVWFERYPYNYTFN